MLKWGFSGVYGGESVLMEGRWSSSGLVGFMVMSVC